MQNETPFVSVLMTSFNREKYIAEAIESVLASSYTNLELIIVDDVSKDSTVSIARKYEQADKRVKVYVNEKNLGDYPNRNRAAGYAKGEYLMYCDSDDSFFPDAVDYCISAMLRFPKASFGMYNKAAESIHCIDARQSVRDHFFSEPILLIGPGGTILKRSFFEQIGGYCTKYGPANDMYFNLNAATKTDLVLFPYLFFNYRRHDGQEQNNPYSYLSNNYLYLKDAFLELDLPLSATEKKWLEKKNKRRYFMNSIRYLRQTKNLKKVLQSFKITGFSWKDICVAVFQKPAQTI